jgi:hypothetical protein
MIDLPISQGCATLALTKGLSVLIDEADLAELSRSKWFATQTRRGGRYYAATDLLAGGRPGRVALHRHLLGEPPGALGDHVNNDSLDCRRRNLRPASRSQNVANGPKRRRGGRASSEFKGVARHERGGRWQAGICKDHHRYHLGIYLAEAALAYDHAARLLFGSFARVNTISAELAPPPARRMAIEREVERRLARVAAAA